MWLDKISTLFIDVAKYIITGVILASFWSDIDNKAVVYLYSTLMVVLCIAASYIAHESIKQKKNKK